MHERSGLERLSGLFLGESLSRQLAKLVVNQRKQLRSGLRIALIDGLKDLRDVGHAHSVDILDRIVLSRLQLVGFEFNFF